MSETPHTPGKLRVTAPSAVGNCVHVISDDLRFQTGCIDFSGNGLANAERLAACWNACTGMADPQATIAALVEALKHSEQALVSLPFDALGMGHDDNHEWALRDELLTQVRAALALVQP